MSTGILSRVSLAQSKVVFDTRYTKSTLLGIKRSRNSCIQAISHSLINQAISDIIDLKETSVLS